MRYPKTRRNEGSVAGGTSLLIWFDRWAVVFEGRSITSERLDTYEQKRENESERELFLKENANKNGRFSNFRTKRQREAKVSFC